MPKQALRGIDELARAYDLSFQHAVYLVLRALGLPAWKAYQWCRPECADKSARVGAARWNKKIGALVSRVEIDDAMRSLADAVAIKAMLTGRMEDKLKGADQVNKRLARYQPESPRISVMGDLFALVQSVGDEAGQPRGPMVEPRRRVIDAEDVSD